MIIGVPNSSDLYETAVNWLNLAWSFNIDCLRDVDQWRRYELEGGANKDDVQRREGKIIKAQRYRITNSLSLLQQSLELFLKAKIADVSPYLLISGDSRSWPKPDSSRNTLDFTELRTIDAGDLIKAVNTVSDAPLPLHFTKQYDDLRKKRNKVIHLDTGNVVFQSKAILIEILTAHAALFPNQAWQQFRMAHLEPTPSQGEEDYDDDLSHDVLMNEIRLLIATLGPSELLRFLGYHEQRESIDCPWCRSCATKYYGDTTKFAQIDSDGSIYCVVCLTKYADRDTYDLAANEYF